LLELGLWRWKKLPPGMTDFLENAGIEIPSENENTIQVSDTTPEENEIIAVFSKITDDKHVARMKALHCVGCGICVPRCENGALLVEGYRVTLDPDKCTGCGKCIHPCTVVDFSPR
jgi:ferredoxin